MARLNWEKMEVDRRTHRYGAARIGSLAGARRDAEADAKPLRPWTDAQLLKLDALQEKRRLQEQEQKERARAKREQNRLKRQQKKEMARAKREQNRVKQQDQKKQARAKRQARLREKEERRAAVAAERRRQNLDEPQDPIERAKRTAKTTGRQARRPSFEVVHVKHRHPVPWPSDAPLYCPRCAGPSEMRIAKRKDPAVVHCTRRCGWIWEARGKQVPAARKIRRLRQPKQLKRSRSGAVAVEN